MTARVSKARGRRESHPRECDSAFGPGRPAARASNQSRSETVGTSAAAQGSTEEEDPDVLQEQSKFQLGGPDQFCYYPGSSV